QDRQVVDQAAQGEVEGAGEEVADLGRVPQAGLDATGEVGGYRSRFEVGELAHGPAVRGPDHAGERGVEGEVVERAVEGHVGHPAPVVGEAADGAFQVGDEGLVGVGQLDVGAGPGGVHGLEAVQAERAEVEGEDIGLFAEQQGHRAAAGGQFGVLGP